MTNVVSNVKGEYIRDCYNLIMVDINRKSAQRVTLGS